MGLIYRKRARKKAKKCGVSSEEEKGHVIRWDKRASFILSGKKRPTTSREEAFQSQRHCMRAPVKELLLRVRRGRVMLPRSQMMTFQSVVFCGNWGEGGVEIESWKLVMWRPSWSVSNLGGGLTRETIFQIEVL